MATPQRVFAESFHFWVLPLILVLLKFLFDLLPKPIFIGGFGLAVGGLYSYDNYRVKQEEKAAEELEQSADAFLEELTASENAAKEKEVLKKVNHHTSGHTYTWLDFQAEKEKQKEQRVKANEQKKRVFIIILLLNAFPLTYFIKNQTLSTSKDASFDDDDEDDDSALDRMAQIQSKKKN
jgi:hypothetical protein